MTAGKWGYAMTVTIRNKRMRQGELRFALQLVAMGAILGGITVAVFLIVRWDEPLDAQQDELGSQQDEPGSQQDVGSATGTHH